MSASPRSVHSLSARPGATGFIGRALLPALRVKGYRVVAASRRAGELRMFEWRTCDMLRPETLPDAFAGVDIAYYLVHSMGGGDRRFQERERRSARAFVTAAAQAGVGRIVYLGGLGSRLPSNPRAGDDSGEQDNPCRAPTCR